MYNCSQWRFKDFSEGEDMKMKEIGPSWGEERGVYFASLLGSTNDSFNSIVLNKDE